VIWLKKTIPHGAGWDDDQRRLMALSMAVAANGTDDYRQIMMFSVEDVSDVSREDDVYVGLPHSAYAPLFAGYDPTEEVPTEVTSLIAVTDTEEFFRMFSVRGYL
jgi:hypothetical protein